MSWDWRTKNDNNSNIDLKTRFLFVELGVNSKIFKYTLATGSEIGHNETVYKSGPKVTPRGNAPASNYLREL